MRVIIFGATGGAGRAAARALLAAGHSVTAFARRPSDLGEAPGQTIVGGDAMNVGDVSSAMPGHDAVMVALGNSQNPFALLFGARRTTPANICEVGTRNIIGAMQASGIARLIVVSAFGVGDTRALASVTNRLFFKLVLREHMADKEKQEAIVKASGLDWVLAQPVALIDGAGLGRWWESADGALGQPMIMRADLASFIARELAAPAHHCATVTLSGAAP
ncbi:MAG: NAD(P)H-binding protein [Hyphomicrobiales bacterium]|nr:NAD(P)H-binding protein [Hyphomicrobiales bacterium]